MAEARRALFDWRGGWLLFAVGGLGGAAFAGALGYGLDAVRYATLAGAFSLLCVHAALHDLRTWLVPNVLTLPGIALALAFSPLWPGREPWEGLAALLVVGAVLIVPYALWGFVLFGWGDVKLALLGAAAVGWADLLLFLLVGSLCGGIWGCAQLLRRRGESSEFPYGPSIAFGVVVALWL